MKKGGTWGNGCMCSLKEWSVQYEYLTFKVSAAGIKKRGLLRELKINQSTKHKCLIFVPLLDYITE
jgi:hypothetical protein